MEHQYIEFENVLSYKTRVDETRLEKLFSYIMRNIDALGLTISGNILFTVSETVELPRKRIMGVEILVPVDKEFESREQYIYKAKFRLVNAALVHFGNIYDFGKANDELMQYLKTNHFNAASAVYYSVNGAESRKLFGVYDAFVSVNDNVV